MERIRARGRMRDPGAPVNFLDATRFLTRNSVHLWDLRHRFGAGGSLLSSDSTLKGLVQS